MLRRVTEGTFALVGIATAVLIARGAPARVVVAFLATAAMIVLPLLGIAYVLGRIWPTPWRYEQAGATLIRIRRATGAADVLTPSGWVAVDDGRDVLHR